MTRKWLALAAALFALLPLSAHAASTFWLEAELFEDLGGWINDAQFVDQMGSPFLMAIGLEGPVKDAVTHVDVPQAGTYHLWVRNRDWLPEFSPGRFQVLLNGAAVQKTFGQGKAKGWVWEDAGVQSLPAGKLEVRLHDLSGHYSRCDALVLSDDPAFVPPDDLAKLAAARIQYGGVSRDVKTVGPYDTVVVGGGLAGTFAAVAAARSGCHTVLVQNRPVLGGNGSSEVLVNPEGDTTREPLDPGEGGIIEEVRGPLRGYSDRMARLVHNQPNLEVLFSTHVTGVQKSAADTITAVEALETTTRQRLLIPGKIFVDCTGDGEVGVFSAAEHRHGREPRSMYNESRAPVEGDTHTMGGTLRYDTEKLTHPVEFKAPEWARHFPNCSDFHTGRHPKLDFGGWQWIIEYGGMRNTYDDAEEIRDELLRIIWGMWDHAKNHCPKLAADAANYHLTWVSHVVGKRESRRLIGDYVLTEHDIAKQVLFPDRVSYAGWGIDIHPPGGFYDTAPPATFSHKLKFSLPFRSMYSKNIANLMMAGRDISVSHVALGATRVMITCGLQGQAVGTAAGVCKAHDTLPRGVYQNYITELQQQLLKDGCYLIDLPNQDPADQARQAKASASSTAPPVRIPKPLAGNLHPLGSPRAVMFKLAAEHLDRMAVYLVSKANKPTPVTLTLRAASSPEDFASTTNMATAKATVPARSQGWVTFQLNARLAPGYYYAMLPKAEGLAWELFEFSPADTCRAYFDGRQWHSSGEAYKFILEPKNLDAAEPARVEPPETLPADMFAAGNVIDGYARAIRGTPHAWRPDPQQPLPQWVELDFGKAINLNCVHVAFQSKPLRAAAFHVDVEQANGWKTVATVDDNDDRRRVLTFDRLTGTRLRLVITAAKPDMGVCEIRAYDQ